MTPARPAPCALLLAALAGGVACGSRAPSGEARGVLVIAVDALRADHLGVSGYDRETSPALDRLAREGLRFEQAFASSPQLLPAHVSLMTGCEPIVARRFLTREFEGLTERRWRIPERVPHLAIELLAAGYATAAFVDHPLLSGAHGFGPGFQRYEVLEQEDREDWEGDQTARVVDHFLQWLRALDPGRSWFAYLHLNQLERFWSEPPREGEGFFPPRAELAQVPPVGNTDSVFFAVPRSRWRAGARTLGHYEASYDEEIRLVDGEIGRLLASLRRIGRHESASIHVVGTYGLQLGEAGLVLCAGRYSRADLSVPWIFRPRAGLEAARGRGVGEIVSLLDLAPTLLELEGLPVPPGMHGLSQAAVARDRSAPAAARRFVFASCGLQEGCAVLGERYALEYFLPRSSDDAQLRRSWVGEWSELALQPRLCFYDRLALPYPPLDGEGRLGPEEEFTSFRAAAVEWLRDVNDARLFLQAPPGRSNLDEATVTRLRDKGLVGTLR